MKCSHFQHSTDLNSGVFSLATARLSGLVCDEFKLRVVRLAKSLQIDKFSEFCRLGMINIIHQLIATNL